MAFTSLYDTVELSPLMIILGAAPARYSAMPSSRRSCKMPDGVPSANTEAPSTTTASAPKVAAVSVSTMASLVVATVARFVPATTNVATTAHPITNPTIRLNHPCFLLRVIRFDDSKRTQATDCRNTAAIESHGLVHKQRLNRAARCRQQLATALGCATLSPASAARTGGPAWRCSRCTRRSAARRAGRLPSGSAGRARR